MTLDLKMKYSFKEIRYYWMNKEPWGAMHRLKPMHGRCKKMLVPIGILLLGRPRRQAINLAQQTCIAW